MPPDNDKIDEMHGMLHAMKPMLEDVRSDQKAMDARMRVSETKSAEHEVKIDRIQSDINGLGDKVRVIDRRSFETPPPPAAPTAPAESKWTPLIEFLASLPAYWHVLGGALAGAGAVVALIMRHKP